MIAVDHRDRLLAAFAQIGDRTVAGLDRAVDHDLVPFLRMPDIGDSERSCCSVQKNGTASNGFAAADHVACGGLALALGDDEMLDADRFAAVRIRPAGDVAGREHAWRARLEELVDEHSAVDGEPGLFGERGRRTDADADND